MEHPFRQKQCPGLDTQATLVREGTGNPELLQEGESRAHEWNMTQRDQCPRGQAVRLFKEWRVLSWA